MQSLAELVRLGYLRGIQKKLDAIEAAHPRCGGFVLHQRALASAFQLDTMAHLIDLALAATRDLRDVA